MWYGTHEQLCLWSLCFYLLFQHFQWIDVHTCSVYIIYLIKVKLLIMTQCCIYLNLATIFLFIIDPYVAKSVHRTYLSKNIYPNTECFTRWCSVLFFIWKSCLAIVLSYVEGYNLTCQSVMRSEMRSSHPLDPYALQRGRLPPATFVNLNDTNCMHWKHTMPQSIALILVRYLYHS